MKTLLKYPIVEIFFSLQGEGYNTGKAVVFIRFGRCNLACAWCDTHYDDYQWLDADAIMAQLERFDCRAVILTGGEPLIQENLLPFLTRLKDLGFWIGVETNGLQAPTEAIRAGIDYLAVSPKADYATRYVPERIIRTADEMRIVVTGEVELFCESMRQLICAEHYFLSPCERKGHFNLEETVRLLGRLNGSRSCDKWLLSLQIHKLAGFR